MDGVEKDDFESGDLWSIRRYIVAGFLAIAVLLALETAYVVHADRRVERQLEWLSRSSLVEVEMASDAALALRQALNAAAIGDAESLGREVDRALVALSRARAATEEGAALEMSAREPRGRESEMAELEEWLDPLLAATAGWRSDMETALAETPRLPPSRLAALQAALESDVLLPLRAYQHNASDELAAQVAALELEAESTARSTWMTSLATLAVALTLSFAIGVAVSKPIEARRRAEERLRLALREKDTLLREVQHRVKNNLQVIASLLDLQGAGTRDERARAILSDLQGRVSAMALLHQQLCADAGTIDARRYFESLLANVTRLHGRLELIPLHGDAADLALDADRLMSSGLVLNELASNALEHGGEQVVARVTRANGNLEITVEDDGEGFGEKTRHGLGLTLVEAFANDLGGSLEIDRGERSRVRVAFPHSVGRRT